MPKKAAVQPFVGSFASIGARNAYMDNSLPLSSYLDLGLRCVSMLKIFEKVQILEKLLQK
jgi:hypothetical protein